jgi:hypothetical protein
MALVESYWLLVATSCRRCSKLEAISDWRQTLFGYPVVLYGETILKGECRNDYSC